MSTLRDLADAVRRYRPDCRGAGIAITDKHVQAARCEAGSPRYEDIDEDEDGGVFDAIIDGAVALAVADFDAA